MHPDDALRVLAERQHGLVSLQQARTILPRQHLSRRLASPDWDLATPRVLRLVGAPRSSAQPLMVAVLDGGPGTVASYAGAAALWRLPGSGFAKIETSRVRGARSRPPSLGHLHRPRYLPDAHLTVVQGIPVTTLPRTIFDLAGRLHPDRTERVVASVIGKSPGTLRVLHRLLAELAEHGRNGIVVMRELLERYPVGCVAEETSLERRVNTILRDAGEAPLVPQVNVGGHEWVGRADFRDPVVPWVLWEVDSQAHHSSPLDVANDAARDASLRDAGFEVRRIPEEHVWYAPSKVLAEVRAVRRAAAVAA